VVAGGASEVGEGEREGVGEVKTRTLTKTVRMRHSAGVANIEEGQTQDPGSKTEPGAPSVALYFREKGCSEILSGIVTRILIRATRLLAVL
jgi:hypothetical protein